MSAAKSYERTRRRLQVGFAVGIVGAGGAICAALIQTKPVIARRPSFARVPAVDVMSIVPHREQSPVVGYGTVRPRNQVEVVPLVSGKLVYSHPDLAPGKVIPNGSVLFEIDPTVYESHVRQVEAEIRQLEAAAGRLDAELASLRERILNSEQMVAIDEEDYLTSKRLYEVEQVGIQRDLDLVHLRFLRQKDALAELTARRSMIPHQKRDIEAQLDGARARLKHANYELEGTKIVCPFDARIESVHARKSQVVTAHLSIATLTDMSAFELSVGLDPRELRWLNKAIQPDALDDADPESAPIVKVRWSLYGQQYTWKGRVTRFERVDERTRTAQMVIEVRNADMTATVEYGDGLSGPSLSIGMFCSAELPARPLEDALLVPRHALYDNQWVYVFEPDTDTDSADGRTGHLARRRVAMLRTVDDAVLVDYRHREGSEVCELAAGEQVVVSRLQKRVVGMRVKLRAPSPIETSVHASARPGETARARRTAALAQIMPLRGGG